MCRPLPLGIALIALGPLPLYTLGARGGSGIFCSCSSCGSFLCPESCLHQGLHSGHLPASPACRPDWDFGRMSKWRRDSCRRQHGATAPATGIAGACRLLSLEAIALFSGLAQGNSSVVFTVGDGWAFSVPGGSPHPLSSWLLVFLQLPWRPIPAVGWNSAGVLVGTVCNCWALGTGYSAKV